MKSRARVFWVPTATIAIAAFSMPHNALAYVPAFNDNCADAGDDPCVSAKNSINGLDGIVAGSVNAIAVVADDSASGTGVSASSNSGTAVYGQSTSSYGVVGISTSGIGVDAYSGSSNAIQAINPLTNWSAAVVTALAGSSSGLSFYGNGGIEIVGATKSTAGGSWTMISDERVKRDVKDFRGGLAELLRVRPVTYKYNGLGGTVDDGKVHVGVIAQELEKIFPAMVGSSRGKLHPTDVEETDIKEVNPSDFTYILVNAVQAQQQIIDRQEARIAALEANRRPFISGVGQSGVGFGLLAVAGAVVFVVRGRKRVGQEA